MSQEKPELTIIILNYNVKELLLNCLSSIFENKQKDDNWQVIVADNDSSDGSLDAVKERFPQVETLQNGSNLGFAKGNNAAIPKARADFILFLNPDTKIIGDAIQKSLEFIKTDPKIGALTCKVELPDGSLDYSCHRGFPTPWNAFCFFTGLASLFPGSKTFSGYTATYLDITKPHEMDCGSGVFLLTRRQAGEEVGFWDEDYFWNGEDIEFCYSLKTKGWKIYFYPEAKITHYKGSSSGLWYTAKTKVPKETKLRSAKNGVQAMRIFYKKHYYKKYPHVLRELVLLGINLLERYRIFKINLKYKNE